MRYEEDFLTQTRFNKFKETAKTWKCFRPSVNNSKFTYYKYKTLGIKNNEFFFKFCIRKKCMKLS